MHERLRNEHAPLHAARQARDAGVGFFGEPEPIDECVDPFAVVAKSVVAALLLQNFLDGEKRVDRDFLRDDPDGHFAEAIIVPDVAAQNFNRSAVGLDQRAERRNERAFACSVGAEQTEEIALLDGKRHVGKCMHAVFAALVGFRQVRNAKRSGKLCGDVHCRLGKMKASEGAFFVDVDFKRLC